MNRTNWRIIKNSEQHAAAMARLIELASGDLQPGTEDFDELELLGLLIEHESFLWISLTRSRL